MSVVFVLVFVAAVVGIFKPYIAGLRRTHFAIAAVVAFFLVGITAEREAAQKGKLSTSPTEASTATASDGAAAGAGSADAATNASKWEYENNKDEMRGTSSKVASVTSNNVVDLAFPYGEVHGQLWVRRRPEDGTNVAFEVEKGQVLCNSFSGGHVSIKFDDRPIQKFSCTGSSDGSSETAFLSSPQRVLAELKRSKRAIVEAEFFQQGRKQFTFDTAGLDWK